MKGYEQAAICPHCGLDTSPPLYDSRPLTPRMVRVLDLLCAGLTNNEMGARLFVSPATVADIVSQCYQRLGVQNRVQAAVAWTQRRAEYIASVDAMRAHIRGTAPSDPTTASHTAMCEIAPI